MQVDETILVVDDFDTNIQILIEILGEDKYKFLIAEDGEKAIDILKIHPVDLVLLDIFMPNVSGYEVCEFIKTNAELKDIPVIFITTLHGEEGVVKGFELGAQDYITKPFKNGELIARVKTQLELKRNREALKFKNKELELKVTEKTAELNEAIENLKYTLKELEKAHKELVELDRAKMRFLKIISHEIRTPLNGIIGFSKLLASSDLEHKYQESVKLISESAIRLEEFSNDALLISQLSLGNYPLLPQKINLSEIVSALLEPVKKRQNNSVKIHMDIPENLTVLFDKQLFEQGIGHLIDNAIVHSGRKAEIWISAKKTPEDIVELTITDNGKGFSNSLIEQGIRLFMTERHQDKNPGLGLALVEQIVQNNKGILELKNDKEKGACVCLKLPA